MLVLDTTPNNEAEGVALAATIDVVFDEAIDPDSVIQNGSFVVVTNAIKVATRGPGFEDLSPSDEDLLESPQFFGFVKGAVATEDNLTFTFTPTADLLPNSQYRVLLGTKIVSRTIGDVEEADGNTSTGSFVTRGPYTGDIDDTFTVEVLGGGTLGIATFRYTRTSDGLPSDTMTTDRLVELEEGVFLRFLAGTFVLGDIWTFEVVVGVPLDAPVEFSFTTGADSHVQVIEEVPSVFIVKREVEGLIRIDDVPSRDGGSLALLSTDPEHQATNQRLGRRQIILTFNKDIDPDSLDDAIIQVIMQSLPMDEALQVSYPIRVTPSVLDNKLILTFTG